MNPYVLLVKSIVRAHAMRTKSGAVTTRRAHPNKVIKKPVLVAPTKPKLEPVEHAGNEHVSERVREEARRFLKPEPRRPKARAIPLPEAMGMGSSEGALEVKTAREQAARRSKATISDVAPTLLLRKKSPQKAPKAMKVGDVAMYLPPGAQRLNKWTVLKLGEKTVTLESSRKSDGSKQTITVPRSEVMSRAAMMEKREPKSKQEGAKTFVDPGKSGARNTLTPEESVSRKEKAEKRVGMGENDIFHEGKGSPAGYARVLASNLGEKSRLSPDEKEVLFQDILMAMVASFRYEASTLPADKIREFADHMAGKRERSAIMGYMTRAAKNVGFLRINQIRLRNQRELSGQEDLEQTAEEAMVSGLESYLAHESGVEDRLDYRKLQEKVESQLGKLPEIQRDTIKRLYGLAPYEDEQSMEEVSSAYREAKRKNPFGKDAWNRNYVAMVHEAALVALQRAEGIEELRPFLEKSKRVMRFRDAFLGVLAKARGFLHQRGRTLAVDFDGVIADYSSGFQGEDIFGDPLPGAVEGLNDLKAEGWAIIIHTARRPSDSLRAYLDAHSIPYDAINGPVESDRDITGAIDLEPTKPIADVYLDDRGIRFEGWQQALKEIRCLKKSYCDILLAGPLEAVHPDAVFIDHERKRLVIIPEEALTKSFSSDLAKKYKGGRWITVTAPGSPLRGRHIFIVDHADGTSSILAGGGPAMRHKILQARQESKPEEQSEAPKQEEAPKSEDTPKIEEKPKAKELSEEEEQVIESRRREVKAGIGEQRKEMAEKVRARMGTETEITPSEREAIERKVEKIADPKVKAVTRLQEVNRLKKEKDDVLHELIKQAKEVVLDENPGATGNGMSISQVVKENAEELLQHYYAIKALERENKDLGKLLKQGKPLTHGNIDAVTVEPMTRRQIEEMVADEKARAEELDAHYKLIAHARGVKGGEKVTNKTVERSIAKGGFEAFTGIVGSATGSAILREAQYEQLGPQNAAVLANYFLRASGGKKPLEEVQKYIMENGSRIAIEANNRGEHYEQQARKVISFGRGDASIMGAAQANAAAMKYTNKAYECYGHAEGALNQAAELMHASAGGIDVLTWNRSSRESLNNIAKKLRIHDQAKIVKTEDGYQMTLSKKHFEKLIGERPSVKSDTLGMEPGQHSVSDIKSFAANEDDFLPSALREWTPPDANGESQSVAAMLASAPHQQATARLLDRKERLYLNHEAGTGKSLTIIAAKAHLEDAHGKPVTTLVTAPAATLDNFADEVRKYSNMPVVVASGTREARRKAYQSAPGTIVVVGHDALREDAAQIHDAKFDMVVVDEAHKLTQREGRGASEKSQGVERVGRDAPYYIAMSGTPTPSDLSELYFHAHTIDPQRFPSQKEFMAQFGDVHKGMGLKEKIADFMATQLDDNVYTVKKPTSDATFTQQTEFVPMSKEQRAAYAKVMEDFRGSKIKGAAFNRDQALAKVLNAGDWRTNPKMDHVAKLIDHHLATKAPDEKVILYAQSHATVKQLRAMLQEKYSHAGKTVLFTGNESSTASKMRANKEAFKHDPGVKFSIHTKAGVEGLNLHYDGNGGGATTAIAIGSGEHTYATLDQFFSRANRRGAKKPIAGHLVMSDSPADMGTMDRLGNKKAVGEMIQNKQKMSKSIVTGLLKSHVSARKKHPMVVFAPFLKSMNAKEKAKAIGDKIGVDWGEVDLGEFAQGMKVEMEHKDVTGGDLAKTARIALAHLKEKKDYYTKLREVEAE